MDRVDAHILLITALEVGVPARIPKTPCHERHCNQEEQHHQDNVRVPNDHPLQVASLLVSGECQQKHGHYENNSLIKQL